MDDLIPRLRTRKAMWLNGSRYCISTEPDADCQEAADEIEHLRRRVSALEWVIWEDMMPEHCSDEANRMIVETVHDKMLRSKEGANG